MSDDTRGHPPSERRLARLWAVGATPASPALVAAAVLLTAGLLMTALGPALWRSAGGLVHEALTLAGDPETALAGVGVLVLRGAVAIAAVAAVLAAVALGVQFLQSGPRPAGPAAQTVPGGATARPALPAPDVARTAVMLALAAVAVTATVRAALTRAGSLASTASLGEAARELAAAVGGPLTGLVLAAALFDALLRRAAWLRTAWMTRRELEEEAREGEGHPLTRRRRVPVRRRHHG